MSEGTVAQFIQRQLSSLPPGVAGDPFNFVNEVLEYLTRWAHVYCHSVALGHPAYCCFVGCERVGATLAQVSDFEDRPLFREDTPADLLDGLYLCSVPFRKVYRRSVQLQSLSACEKAISSLGLAGSPTVFFNAAERRVLWRTGIGQELHQAVLLNDKGPAITSSDLEKALENFHHEYTETPQGLTRPWKNATKLETKSRLEEEIRDDLYIYLRFLLRDHFAVFREFYNPAGRTDLLINFHSEGKVVYLELKVFRQGEDAIDWGKKGIVQAFGYKQSNQGVGLAYACCFDARKNNEELQELVQFAARKDVRYARFFMYANTDDFHRALMN